MTQTVSGLMKALSSWPPSKVAWQQHGYRDNTIWSLDFNLTSRARQTSSRTGVLPVVQAQTDKQRVILTGCVCLP